MHTCIAYSSCITLTPYFAAIIDSSGSSCVWGQKGGRLVKTDLSPKSIAKDILCKLEKSPINPLCLEAALIPIEQELEMEQQQGGNWTLEDIKGALMDDMRAMMQDELRQALVGILPPLAAAPAPVAVIPLTTVNPPVENTPPAKNDNVGG